VAVGSYDGRIFVYKPTGELVWEITAEQDGHTSWVNSVTFVPQSRSVQLVSASEDGTVKIWDVANKILSKTFVGGKLVDDRTEEESRERLKKDKADLAVKAMYVTDDGSLIVYGCRDSTVNLVNLNV